MATTEATSPSATGSSAAKPQRVGFTNIPMTHAEHDRFVRQDAAWTGPKLIITAFVVLALAFLVLGLSAHQIIGPDFNDGRPAAHD